MKQKISISPMIEAMKKAHIATGITTPLPPDRKDVPHIPRPSVRKQDTARIYPPRDYERTVPPISTHRSAQHFTEDTVKWFWERVDKRGADECWNWIGKLTPQGYGAGKTFSGRSYSAPRLSWRIHYGDIPAGKGHFGTVVRHVCPGRENRRCVNPNHLRLGDMRDNRHDREKYRTQSVYS